MCTISRIVSNIQNKKSPFRKDKYDRWDSVAKSIIRTYLITKKGYQLASDVEDYNADIKVVKPEVSYHEVEVKLGWKEEWPEHWHTIHIPYRKKRLIDMMDLPNRLTFYVLRKDLKQAWLIKGSACKEVVEIANKFMPKGEYFFNIPIKDARLINL